MAETKKGRPPAQKFTCKEILDIIQCGNKHKVAKICLGDISISYLAGIDEITKSNGAGPLPAKELHEEVEKFATNQELEMKEAELALMAIEDPEQYEKLMASGDLVDLTEKEEDGNG